MVGGVALGRMTVTAHFIDGSEIALGVTVIVTGFDDGGVVVDVSGGTVVGGVGGCLWVSIVTSMPWCFL